jgi:S1-C subfamily serine protease
VRDGDELREALDKAGAGAEVTLSVQRDGKPLDLKVKLGGTAETRRRGMTT